MNKKSTLRSVANDYLTHPKKQKGITLIALVITIIVLLILAGVTIAMVVGDNGIISRSREAKDTTNIKKIQEEVDLEAADLVAEYHSKDNGEVPSKAGDYVAANIVSKFGSGIVTPDESNARIITVEKDGVTTVGTIQDDGSILWNEASSTVAGGGSGSGSGSGSGEQGGGTTTPTPSPSPSPAVTITTDNYGDSVNYSTTLNGQTLTNWKIFHQEGNYVWLIYGDYLENAAIPTPTNISKNGYRVCSSTNRIDLINYLTTKSNWSSLLTGTINGNAIDYTSSEDSNITAMGSPTLELYKNSWNAKYPNTSTYTTNQIYTATTSSAMSDGLNGYYVSKTNNPPTTSEYGAQMSGSQGYPDATNANVLYYPHACESAWNDTYGYWLASPSAYGTKARDVILVYNHGMVDYNRYNYDLYACRPVVCLPSSALN